MILMIDNYDSFTFNIVQYLGQMGEDVQVFRNDRITLEEIKKLNPQAIFLSPGPRSPIDAGITVDVIRNFYTLVPIMGICLGHQSIGYAFGEKSSGPITSCMAKHHRSIMTGKPYLPVCRILLPAGDIIP